MPETELQSLDTIVAQSDAVSETLREREIAAMALQLMADHQLSAWRFEFDAARRRFGLCSHRRRVISLSRELCRLNCPMQIRDTLLHEIAHARSPGAGHGRGWQRAAREVGCAATRCYDESVITPPATYRGECPACHKITTRHHLTARAQRLACGRCCRGTYQPEFKLVWSRA